jgi:hypothetical protein
MYDVSIHAPNLGQGLFRYKSFRCELRCEHRGMLQAFSDYEDKVIHNSLEVDSDPRDLFRSFDPERPLVYKASAELGAIGMTFSQPYTNIDVEVEAVLNQEEENDRIQRAIQMYASLASLASLA